MDIKEKVFIKKIYTTEDIRILEKCQFFSTVDTHSQLLISQDVVFHDDVTCYSLFIEAGVKIQFKGNIYCNILTIASYRSVDGRIAQVICEKHFSISESLLGDMNLIVCTDLNLPRIAPVEPVFPEVSRVEIVPQSTDLILGVCEGCKQETNVHTIFGENEDRVSLCFECAAWFTREEDKNALVPRHPSEWEITHMNEEEKTFLAEHGYVTFPPKVPEEPFIRVEQESQDGELLYKDVYICDPELRYISEEDTENYKARVVYNGGPYAWLLQGTSSAASLYALMALAPTIGPVLAAAGWIASLPFGWKCSKKITNYINDKIVLPQEIKARRNLINARRRDEEARDDVYIETV